MIAKCQSNAPPSQPPSVIAAGKRIAAKMGDASYTCQPLMHMRITAAALIQ
jgi:hypothetical protein